MLCRVRLRERPIQRSMQQMVTNCYYSTLEDRVAPPSAHVLQKKWPQLKRKFAERLDENGKYCLLTEKQREVLERFPLRAERNAAVLVLILSVEGEPSVLFTKRSEHMTLHAAEISFPGGHHDGQDGSLEQTALREFQEEVRPETGFMDTVRVLGEANSIPSLKGTPVTPVLAVSFRDDIVDSQLVPHIFPGDNDEVEAVFCCSIQKLMDSEEYHRLPQNRFGVSHAPVFPTNVYGNIWGLTAMILRPLLHQLLYPTFSVK